MMFVDALFKAIPNVKNKQLQKTLKDDAYYMLDIVYPYNTLINPYKYKGNPRWCTQYVNSITNEHIGPILSGTSTWLLISTLESLGLRFLNDKFIIRPMLREGVNWLRIHIHIQNAFYDIEINNGEVDELSIPYFRDGKIHEYQINHQ